MGESYLRKFSLLVGDDSGNAFDLSELKVAFSVTSQTVQSPRIIECRIYNLSDTKSKRIQQEFTQIQLSAGYETGVFGSIFTGTISQFRRGRENATDTYLDIIGMDSDFNYNHTVSSSSLASGWTSASLLDVLTRDINCDIATNPVLNESVAGIRGKVIFGMTRDRIRDFCKANEHDWFLEDGKLQFVPYLGYIPGVAIVVNAQTGMVGTPEQTIDGVFVRMLLNAQVKTGRILQIDAEAINNAQVFNKASYPGEFPLPSLASDGLYKVYNLRHIGDTRATPWYTEAICVKLNPAAGDVPVLSSLRINSLVNGQ